MALFESGAAGRIASAHNTNVFQANDNITQSSRPPTAPLKPTVAAPPAPAPLPQTTTSVIGAASNGLPLDSAAADAPVAHTNGSSAETVATDSAAVVDNLSSSGMPDLLSVPAPPSSEPSNSDESMDVDDLGL
ncbi:hypothetical protein IWW38_005894 [Coemansia aciculifera]|uniref:Uncharacterized protein n=1 Tax=Coemansia aciculifera TaxID=417176 RepID=A0ACC1LVA0_9FUNG|nr:hypothetical protein IWW38_005894 [Coemansia aciculifera]